MLKRKQGWTGIILVMMLVVMLSANIGWLVYRYGGEHYYLTIGRKAGTHPLTLAGGVAANGPIYQGDAVSAQGRHKFIRLKTVAVDPGPFKRGEVVRVTWNRHFGVTNYERVAGPNPVSNLRKS